MFFLLAAAICASFNSLLGANSANAPLPDGATKDPWSLDDAWHERTDTFTGVEHRLETVRVHKGVRYINSSIDSSPSRTAAALGCFTEKVICICGGYDKHIPFAPLADALCVHAKAVVLTGATADAIEKALTECECDTKPAVYRDPDFKEAVLLASSLSQNGDTVILSPACASFDAFKNFMERGDTFRKIISELE